MSAELTDRGIRVNVLSPGPTDTALLGAADLPQDTIQQMKQEIMSVPAGRIASSNELAYAALFLASDRSRYMLGSELVVDGGLTQL